MYVLLLFALLFKYNMWKTLEVINNNQIILFRTTITNVNATFIPVLKWPWCLLDIGCGDVYSILLRSLLLIFFLPFFLIHCLINYCKTTHHKFTSKIQHNPFNFQCNLLSALGISCITGFHGTDTWDCIPNVSSKQKQKKYDILWGFSTLHNIQYRKLFWGLQITFKDQ